MPLEMHGKRISAGGAASARPVKPATTRVVLALDLADRTGWAASTRDGQIVSGTQNFRPPRMATGGFRFLAFLHWLSPLSKEFGGIDEVRFEEVRRHTGTTAAHVYGAYVGHLLVWCEQRGVEACGVPVGEIKKFATGRGNADKGAMVDAARRRGFTPIDHNEADALWLLLLTLHQLGDV